MNSKGGPVGKKCFIEAPETHPDILRGGHKNPYQLENAIKSGGTVFCIPISLGLNSLPVSCGAPAFQMFNIDIQCSTYSQAVPVPR